MEVFWWIFFTFLGERANYNSIFFVAISVEWTLYNRERFLVRNYLNNFSFRNVFDPRQMRISVQGSGLYIKRERGCR